MGGDKLQLLRCRYIQYQADAEATLRFPESSVQDIQMPQEL